MYAGEAMLALMEVYARLRQDRHLRSVERACAFYDAACFERDRIADDLLVFFANWQSQACRALFDHARSADVARRVQGYLCRMHDRIIERGFYRAVEERPAVQVSVEVACALEGLAEACATAADQARAERYRRCACIGLDYLLDVQCTRDGAPRERGGFGMSLDERAQRIDVTGHAASAFMKCIEADVTCGT